MVDTGAHDNIAGREWVERVVHSTSAQGQSHQPSMEQLTKPVSISGIGNGAQIAKEAVTLPITMGKDGATFWAPVVDGTGSSLPGIMGLKSLTRHHAIVDCRGKGRLIIPGPGGIHIGISPGSKVIQCERSPSGHMMVPCNIWQSRTDNIDSSKWKMYSSSDEIIELVDTDRFSRAEKQPRLDQDPIGPVGVDRLLSDAEARIINSIRGIWSSTPSSSSGSRPSKRPVDLE